ncbi:hypothetical protein HZS_6794 [Henneguya salminicola]|nr:hypothetical protein HZS_6794 [Henneguya salminicola]
MKLSHYFGALLLESQLVLIIYSSCKDFRPLPFCDYSINPDSMLPYSQIELATAKKNARQY